MGPFLERYRGAIYVILLILTAAGVYALFVRAPRAEPIEIIQVTPSPMTSVTAPAPQERRIMVHVVGQVQRPGVYELNGDARVVDAVNAAGGLTAAADPEAINLADRVSDGLQVRVPALAAEPLPSLTPYAAPAAQRYGTGLQSGGSGALLNINTASAAELEVLPGIGPALAERIVAYRAENGPFGVIEEIMDVSGIGEAIFGRVRALIAVE
jgi:competence protein ComEA